MTAVKITLLYSFFAVMATLVNLLTQEITSALVLASFELQAAIVMGTATGLITKYVLDKHFIFKYRSSSTRDSIQRFGVYSLTGVFTTLLFWGFEFGFDAYFDTKTGRYAGAIIGLAIGYGIKYHLDKRFVFNSWE